jgi:hypothetical protein
MNARNASTAQVASAALNAASQVDPNVPVALLGLTPGPVSAAPVDPWRVQASLVFTGTSTPDCVGALTNLYTAELSRALSMPVRPLPVVIT